MEGILTNIQRFVMRGLKGMRKKDKEKLQLNLIISLSWFVSLMNMLRIDIEEELWQRFPGVCSYCGSVPCACKEKKIQKRVALIKKGKKRPTTLAEFQSMFAFVYPSSRRTLEEGGIHLAEEMGELSEAVLKYRGAREAVDFKHIEEEAADFFSCLMGVFNSLDISVPKELSRLFPENCHECGKAPCQCSFSHVMNFKS